MERSSSEVTGVKVNTCRRTIIYNTEIHFSEEIFHHLISAVIGLISPNRRMAVKRSPQRINGDGSCSVRLIKQSRLA